jgi:NAD(P)-dependent dehydrogenase (short-subunit alcohol dehydrogenase family)
VTVEQDAYLPPEATGSTPGRARLAWRRVLVIGAGTRPSPEPDPPIGNGRAITVLSAREGASVVCADRDQAAAEATAALARAEGARAEVVVADVADPAACAAVVGRHPSHSAPPGPETCCPRA